MDKQLRRILDLVRKTGDRMVVTDTNGEDIYVVMGLDQYESLVDVDRLDGGDDWDEGWWDGHTGGDIPPFCGPDLVDNLEPSDPGALRPSEPPKNLWEAMQPAGSEGETWDVGKMSAVEKADLERQYQEYQRQKMAETAESPEKAETSEPEAKLSSVEVSEGKKDEDFGEEQFYLEPIE